MPELLWLYLTALLSYRTSGSWVALAEALETVSHDRLTRLPAGELVGANTPRIHLSHAVRLGTGLFDFG
jgi:hypothetical protein